MTDNNVEQEQTPVIEANESNESWDRLDRAYEDIENVVGSIYHKGGYRGLIENGYLEEEDAKQEIRISLFQSWQNKENTDSKGHRDWLKYREHVQSYYGWSDDETAEKEKDIFIGYSKTRAKWNVTKNLRYSMGVTSHHSENYRGQIKLEDRTETMSSMEERHGDDIEYVDALLSLMSEKDDDRTSFLLTFREVGIDVDEESAQELDLRQLLGEVGKETYTALWREKKDTGGRGTPVMTDESLNTELLVFDALYLADQPLKTMWEREFGETNINYENVKSASRRVSKLISSESFKQRLIEELKKKLSPQSQ